MSIDDRLREGLRRSMSAIDSDAEGHLGVARRRGHRRLVIRRATAVVAIAAAVLVVVVAAPGVRELMRDQGWRPAAPPSPASISGTYTTTIRTNDLADSGGAGAIGTWLLTLDGNGTLDLASLTNGDQGRSITQYQVTGGQFITTALTDATCSGTGLYTWSRTGTALTFSVVSDPCPLRVAIFSAHAWTST